MNNQTKEFIKLTLNYTFQILLFIFLITLLIQQFYPIEVESRININWFMFAVIVIGAISILFPIKEKKKEHKKPTKKDLITIILLGILSTIIIFLKLNELGWISYPISLLGGVMVIILSWLLLNEH
jgi:predicted membrane channel-forming protein YqfA (hemolysin III family)